MGEEEIGAYRPEAVLGEGRGGVVYRAGDAAGEAVALRVIAPDASAGPWFADRCLRALQPYAALRHPALLSPREVGEHAGRVFVAMPLATGTLAERLGESWTVAKVADLLRPVAEALDLLHARRLIHGDVRPANLLFDAGRQLLLADAGLAPALRDANGFSLGDGAARVPGDPDYQAPEQFQFTPFDTRADLYSFGAVAYALLTGQPPFAGETRDELAAAHAQMPPAPSEINPLLPGALDAVFAKALARFPFERYSSAVAFCDAIAAAQPDIQPVTDGAAPTSARPETAPAAVAPAVVAPIQAAPADDAPVEVAPPAAAPPVALLAPAIPAPAQEPPRAVMAEARNGWPDMPLRTFGPVAIEAAPAFPAQPSARKRRPSWARGYQYGPAEILYNGFLKPPGVGLTGALGIGAAAMLCAGNGTLVIVLAILFGLVIGAYFVFGTTTIVACDEDELSVERRNVLSQESYNIFRWDEFTALRYADSRPAADGPVTASFIAVVGYGEAFHFTEAVDGFEQLIETCTERCKHLPYTWVRTQEVLSRPVLETHLMYSKIPREWATGEPDAIASG
jgi:hypothetical protein